MTNSSLLKKTIVESGMSITFISAKLGLTREGFYKKLNNKTEFKASEIDKLARILHLSKDKRDLIFFSKKCEL